MSEYFHTFFLCFIPLFVAMDVIAVIPVYASLTERMDEEEKKSLLIQSTTTAFAVGMIFLLVGHALFKFLGITNSDFKIAGGLVLVLLAINDLLFSQYQTRRRPPVGAGVVPIGIPLIMGPAALTTILILKGNYGFTYTGSALLINLVIVWLCFRYCQFIAKLIGPGGMKAIVKLVSLFLAAIGVMMMRKGITELIL